VRSDPEDGSCGRAESARADDWTAAKAPRGSSDMLDPVSCRRVQPSPCRFAYIFVSVVYGAEIRAGRGRYSRAISRVLRFAGRRPADAKATSRIAGHPLAPSSSWSSFSSTDCGSEHSSPEYLEARVIAGAQAISYLSGQSSSALSWTSIRYKWSESRWSLCEDARLLEIWVQVTPVRYGLHIHPRRRSVVLVLLVPLRPMRILGFRRSCPSHSLL